MFSITSLFNTGGQGLGGLKRPCKFVLHQVIHNLMRSLTQQIILLKSDHFLSAVLYVYSGGAKSFQQPNTVVFN